MAKPKIMVCVPTAGTINSYMAMWLLNISKTPNYQVAINILTHKPTISCRNLLTNDFLNSDYEYSFWVDDDIIPMGDGLALANFKKDIVSQICLVGKNDKLVTLALDKIGEEQYRPIDPRRLKAPLTEVDAVGSGAVMIHRRVFEKLGPPWWKDKNNEMGARSLGHDFLLCDRAKAAGFKIYVDPRVIASHITTINLRGVYDLMLDMEKHFNEVLHKNALQHTQPKVGPIGV